MAYAAVVTPTEGTILTVAREAMEGVRERVSADDERDLVAILKTMVFAARASLRRTPELLPVLKQAGVVDSAARGWSTCSKACTSSCRQDVSRAGRRGHDPGAGLAAALEPSDDEGTAMTSSSAFTAII